METNGREFYIKWTDREMPFADIHGIDDFSNDLMWLDIDCKSWEDAVNDVRQYVKAICYKLTKDTGKRYVYYLCETDEWVADYPYPNMLEPGEQCPIKWKTLTFNYGRADSPDGKGCVMLAYKEFCYHMTKQEAMRLKVV